MAKGGLVSIGNPETGYCPACNKGILEPAEICVEANKECVDYCGGCPQECRTSGELIDGIICPKCGYISTDI